MNNVLSKIVMVMVVIVAVVIIAGLIVFSKFEAEPSLVGQPAPEIMVDQKFKVPAAMTEGVSISALKGKVILLDFWATWCGPCVKSIPHLKELHRDYADKGLVIIGYRSRHTPLAFNTHTVQPKANDARQRRKRGRKRSKMFLFGQSGGAWSPPKVCTARCGPITSQSLSTSLKSSKSPSSGLHSPHPAE